MASSSDRADEERRTYTENGTWASSVSTGKRREWTMDQHLLALKAITTVPAHVAPRGHGVKRFEEAASVFNQRPQAAFQMSGKILRDHYINISAQFVADNKREERRTGHEVVLSEREKLLADIVEAGNALRAQEDAAKCEGTEEKQKQDAAGQAVRVMAMERLRKRQRESSIDHDVDEGKGAPSAT